MNAPEALDLYDEYDLYDDTYEDLYYEIYQSLKGEEIINREKGKIVQSDEIDGLEREFSKEFIDELSLDEIDFILGNASKLLSRDDMERVKGLDFHARKRVIEKFHKLEKDVPVTKLTAQELEDTRALDISEKQVEIDFMSLEGDELYKALQIRDVAEDLREIYKDYYYTSLRDKVKGFILETEVPEILQFEARLKTNASVYRSVKFKNEYDGPNDLKDYVGMRFIVNNERDAYSLAKLFKVSEVDRNGYFNLINTKDYFVTPKLDAKGNVQYEGLHMILEDNGYKFEIQIHTKATYINTELTHQDYENRPRIARRETAKINFEGITE